METNDINNNLIDSYFFLLKNMSRDNKLELIAKLNDSIKKREHSGDYSLKLLSGEFIPEKSADEIVREVKEARTFYHKTEEF